MSCTITAGAENQVSKHSIPNERDGCRDGSFSKQGHRPVGGGEKENSHFPKFTAEHEKERLNQRRNSLSRKAQKRRPQKRGGKRKIQ